MIATNVQNYQRLENFASSVTPKILPFHKCLADEWSHPLKKHKPRDSPFDKIRLCIGTKMKLKQDRISDQYRWNDSPSDSKIRTCPLVPSKSLTSSNHSPNIRPEIPECLRNNALYTTLSRGVDWLRQGRGHTQRCNYVIGVEDSKQCCFCH